jgi:hypothetical protein
MPKFNGQNKKRIDPRYFLNEQGKFFGQELPDVSAGQSPKSAEEWARSLGGDEAAADLEAASAAALSAGAESAEQYARELGGEEGAAAFEAGDLIKLIDDNVEKDWSLDDWNDPKFIGPPGEDVKLRMIKENPRLVKALGKGGQDQRTAWNLLRNWLLKNWYRPTYKQKMKQKKQMKDVEKLRGVEW